MNINMEVKKTDDLDTDVLINIVRKLLEGDIKVKQAEKIQKTIKESPSLEEMKSELESYEKIVKTLVNKIKEEENRRKQETHHFIEKKLRNVIHRDIILEGCNRKDYKSENKEFGYNEEIEYKRVGNKIICKINCCGAIGIGTAIQHHEDKFDYKFGMSLARTRAVQSLYKEAEKILVESTK